jgi:hypothetical protein
VARAMCRPALLPENANAADFGLALGQKGAIVAAGGMTGAPAQPRPRYPAALARPIGRVHVRDEIENRIKAILGGHR